MHAAPAATSPLGSPVSVRYRAQVGPGSAGAGGSSGAGAGSSGLVPAAPISPTVALMSPEEASLLAAAGIGRSPEQQYALKEWAARVLQRAWVAKREAAAAAAAVVLGSWLWKRGQYNADFKRRWCELLFNGTFRYLTAPGGKERGAFDVRGASVAIIPPATRSQRFQIEVCPPNVARWRGLGGLGLQIFDAKYVLEAEVEADVGRWHEMLLQAANGSLQRAAPATASSALLGQAAASQRSQRYVGASTRMN